MKNDVRALQGGHYWQLGPGLEWEEAALVIDLKCLDGYGGVPQCGEEHEHGESCDFFWELVSNPF